MQFSDALAKFSRDNPWLLPALAAVSAVGTFFLAGVTVALFFSVGVLLVLLIAALRSLMSVSSQPTVDPPTPEVVDTDTLKLGDSGRDDSKLQAPAEASSTKSDPPAETSDDDEMRAALDLAWKGDIAAVRARYEAALEAAEDKERPRIEGIYQFLLVKAGDPGALGRMRATAEADTPPDPQMLSWYASALDMVGESVQTSEVLVRLSESYSVDDRSDALLHAARLLAEDEQAPQAAAIVEPMTSNMAVSKGRRAEAWSIIARSRAEAASPYEAMTCYERSVQLNPSNASVRFSLAYLYSESGFDRLALHHYKVLERTNQATAVALNNLAVCETHLQMPGRAFAHYKQAGDAGSALAWANLGQVLISAGALDDARSAIERGEAIDSSDTRVVAARERLTDVEETDVNAGRKLTRFRPG